MLLPFPWNTDEGYDKPPHITGAKVYEYMCKNPADKDGQPLNQSLNSFIR